MLQITLHHAKMNDELVAKIGPFINETKIQMPKQKYLGQMKLKERAIGLRFATQLAVSR